MTVLHFCLNTYDNHRFWEIEEGKTMTVLLCCFTIYENHLFWEIDEWKTMTVCLCCLNTDENHKFWEVEEHRRFDVSTAALGSANLWWCRHGGTRASKPVLVHTNGNVSLFWWQNKILGPGPANMCWCTRNSKSVFWRSKKEILDPPSSNSKSLFWRSKNEILDPRADSKWPPIFSSAVCHCYIWHLNIDICW